MDINNFKNIIGEAKSGDVAVIRFFGKVTEESTCQFNAEFDYLENIIQPSLIRVLINSEGGSVLFGMTTYSTIQNCKLPTECVIEGMAASMGSIIWAAGDKSLMRDYSILMIHNPCQPSADDKEGVSDLVQAFTKQIETIYRKRFGLKADHVRSIMNGQADKDGTFFDAAAAVKAGIIPAENILHTSKQICDKVKCELSGIEDISQIQALMTRISGSIPVETENKPFLSKSPNLTQIDNSKTMSTEKNNTPEYAAVAASLGMKENFEVKDVMARISALVSVEAKLKETEKSLTDAQTVIAGKEATISNLQKDLTTATTSLGTYQQKEATEKKNRIETMIEAAINAGKIARETKTDWVTMAENNIDLAEKTLASIPAREQISAEIASDPANIQAAANATQTVEQKLAKEVAAVVGEKFEFKKIQ